MLNFRQPGNFDRGDQTTRVRGQMTMTEGKVRKIFENRFKEKDFKGRPYSDADVDIDLAKVAELKQKHRGNETSQSRELKKVADLFEALVLYSAEVAKWFGQSASATKTSEFDDFVNRVDMVVEFREGRSPSHLGLAADVTFSSDPQVISKKFDFLRTQIRSGSLAKVKYFHSDFNHFDGQLSKIPEVVIGVSGKMVSELEHLWASGRNNDLTSHRAGVMILRQIEAQLTTFVSYANSIGQPEVARICGDRLQDIKGILAEKAELVAKVEATKADDPVHEEIMKFAKNWSRY